MYWRFWIWLLLTAPACHPYEDSLLRVGESRSEQEEAPHREEPEACMPNPDGADSACPEVCPEQCNGQDDDCDGRIDEGRASSTCAVDSAESVCLDGHCEIARCLQDSRDCDGLAANGCEVTGNDADHCGGCERRCDSAHARSACDSGECQLESCDSGFADCDADSGNGCEASLRTERNCGGCGVACAPGVSCVSGVCVAASEPALDCSQSPYAAGQACEEDLCPADPNKRVPGSCGCGVPDADSDADGSVDCMDTCPNGAWSTTAACLPFIPANLDPTKLDFANTAPALFNCGVTTLDTSPSTPALSNSCGVTARISVQTQADGTSVVVLTTRGLTVAAGSTLRLIGSRPVAIAALGDVLVEGNIDASAQDERPGAGGDQSCGASAGTDGSGNTLFGAAGGGGGGFGTSGGAGGTGNGARAGVGGVLRGDDSLMPLRGGCAGGRGGGCSGRAAGGGALQLSASGRVNLRGAIRANGADGTQGCGFEGGGSGGGSGGGILIEARAIEAGAMTLEANGGTGGDADGVGGDGSTAPTLAGAAGESDSANGGGGGGGGYGRIRTVLHD